MNETGFRRIAWILAVGVLVVLLVSVILVLLSPTGQDTRYLEILSGAIIGCGSPILGLVILRQQPLNRIGWLWLFIGLAISFFSLSYAIKYHENSSPPSGYPTPVFVMLLFSETAYIVRFICMILLMLWFPNGQPLSPRWRSLNWWMAIAFIMLTLGLFSKHISWSDIDGVVWGAQTFKNPIGFLPDGLNPILSLLAPIGFFSIIAMLLLAVLSIVIRYRSAGQMVRAQILWFVMGGVVYAICFVAAIIILNYQSQLPGVLGNLAILPFYLAIGIAITRHRLYDIDVIIRRTLVYSILTALLGLVYYGGVVVLQSILTADRSQPSAVVIVITTLAIATLFSPLRRRIQDFIDRRFYRSKYNAEKALAQFAAAARNETDLELLTVDLVRVVQETLQPAAVSVWTTSLGAQLALQSPGEEGKQ